METGIGVFVALVAFQLWREWHARRLAARELRRNFPDMQMRDGRWHLANPPEPLARRLFVAVWWTVWLAAVPVGLWLNAR